MEVGLNMVGSLLVHIAKFDIYTCKGVYLTPEFGEHLPNTFYL